MNNTQIASELVRVAKLMVARPRDRREEERLEDDLADMGKQVARSLSGKSLHGVHFGAVRRGGGSTERWSVEGEGSLPRGGPEFSLFHSGQTRLADLMRP